MRLKDYLDQRVTQGELFKMANKPLPSIQAE